ncbi:YadA-like family protein [Phocoenobacter skyensis]|uniref:YadA-like family protein n=1 Tax=Phocoenobacter skyensis TaxID=97481 RepID=A0AAJ6NCT1_9PAST|nr:YadA-like family protein [Pasteurella skyensis]MDP8174457.1 YadA-like family protein [Pasteurella skyensis]
MNNIYKVVFNKATQTFTAVSELAKGRTKAQSLTIDKPQQAVTFSFKFAKIALAISMVFGIGLSAMALTPEEQQAFDDLKAEVEALKAQKNYFHVNTTDTVQTGNEENLDTVDGVGGAKGIGAIAIGMNAVAEGRDSVVIGGNGTNVANESYSIAMGRFSNAKGAHSISLGRSTDALGESSVAFGMGTEAFGDNSIVMGSSGKAIGRGSLAIGGYSGYYDGGPLGDWKNGADGARANTDGSIAIGIGTVAGKAATVVKDGKVKYVEKSNNEDDDDGFGGGLGFGGGSGGYDTVVVGDSYETVPEEAVAIGYRSKAIADKTVALGFDAVANVDGGFALGSNAKANTGAGTFGYDLATDAVSIDESAIWKSTMGALAIGDAESNKTRQITGLAAGTDDDDAVNVAQLKKAVAGVGAGAGTGGATPKNYFHVNATNQVQPGNTTNLDSVDGIGGATGEYSTAIGINAQANQKNSIAIGNGATTVDFSDILNTRVNESTFGTIAIGNNVTAEGAGSVAIGGKNNTVTGMRAVAIGGSHNRALGRNSTAMGQSTTASGTDSTAMGWYASAAGRASTAMGWRASAVGEASTSMGYSTHASGQSSTAIGAHTQALNTGTLAMGAYTTANGLVSTAMGTNTRAIGDNSFTLGVGSKAYGKSSLATGGYGSYYDQARFELYNKVTTVHEGGKAYTDGSMALGVGTVAGTGTYDDNGTPDDFSDDTYTAGTEEAVAMGYRSKAIADKTMALGFDAEATVEGGFALGSNAKADTAKGRSGYDLSTNTNSTETSATWRSTMGALAIGGEDKNGDLQTRQITGLAAGSDDDDAVNVAQLKKVVTAATGNIEHPKNYVHVNATGQVQTGNDTNLDSVDGVGGAKGEFSVAAGKDAQADQYGSIAIGHEARTVNFEDFSQSMGVDESTLGSVALGQQALAGVAGSVAIGHGATVTATAPDAARINGSVAIGYGSIVDNAYNGFAAAGGHVKGSGIAIGEDSVSNGGFAINSGQALGQWSLVSGTNAKATQRGGIAFGENSKSLGQESIAMGHGAEAHEDGAIALGGVGERQMPAKAYTIASIAIGRETVAGKKYEPMISNRNLKALAIGNYASAIEDESMAIGFDSHSTVAGGVALGSNAKANTTLGKAGYDWLTKTASTDESAVWKSTMGALAIGDAENNKTRQITGLAAGTDDDDAVNVAQLKKVVTAATGNIEHPKNYVHVNATGQVQTGNDTNLDSVDGVGGAKGVASIAAGINARALVENGIALGTGAKTVPEYGVGSGGVAIGTGAESHLMTNGTHEGLIIFGRKRADLVGGIAIGQSTHARIGNVDIGNRDYKGEIGDINFNSNYLYNPHNYTAGVGATTVGDNSVNAGNLSTISGGFNAITRTANGGNRVFRVGRMMQGFGSNILGTLNSIEGNEALTGSPSNVDEVNGLMYSGMLSSVVGTGNRVNKSNGSLIMGTGNEITNSYLSPTGENNIAKMVLDNKADLTSKGKSVTELAEAIRDYSKENNLGSVGIVGGSNKADHALFTNISGVGNTVSGQGNVADLSQVTKKTDVSTGYEKMSAFNIVDGFENTGENITHANIQGSHNTVTNALKNIVMGNNHNVLGETDNLAEGNVILGFNKKVDGGSIKTSAKDIFVLGNDVKANTDNSVYLGSNTTEANVNATVGNGEYLTAMEGYNDKFAGRVADGIVSVGSEGKERRIQNVAAGLISQTSTDAINGSQLYAVAKTLDDKIDAIPEIEVGKGTNIASVKKTTANGKDTYTVNAEGTIVSAVVGGDIVISSTTDTTTNDTTYTVRLSDDFKTKAKDQSVEKVVAGSGIQVTSTADDDKTYTVALDQTTKTQLAKEESVVSTNNNVAITHATTNSTGGLEYVLTLASNLTGMTSIGNTPNGGKITLGETDKNISVNGGKITNVAKGTANTDAVNVKQLKDYVTSTAKPTAVTVNEGTEANSNAYNTTGNLQIKETTANGGKPTYDIKLADKVTLGTADNQIVIDGTTGNITAGGVAIDGTAKTVKGLSNTTFDPNATYTGGQAATQEQLKAVSDVAADKSIEKVVGTNGIAVTSSTGETDKTYTVGLDTTTKNSIDSALQSIVTQIDGAEVKTLTKDNNNANFLTGKNIVLTNESGDIKVATADNLKGLTSVVLGNALGNDTVSLTTGGINAGQKVITNVATGINGTDAVNVAQLTDTVNKSKVEVKNGTNVADVVKTTGTDGHDIYTVNVEGTKVAGSTDVVVSSTTDATTNDTTYTVRLSDDFKTKAKDQSVEKVVAGTGIQVTSTADDDKTYTVALDQTTKTQLAKEESVVSTNNNVAITHATTNSTGGFEYALTLTSNLTGMTSIGNTPNGGKITLGETDKNISVNGGKITNIAKGTANTDAVNVKQLKDYVTSTAKPTAVTVNEGTEANSNAYNTTGNLQIKETTANGGKPTYDIKLADKVTLGTADNQIVIDGTAGNVTAGQVTINGTAGTVNNLTNKTFDPDNFTSGQAATEDQLKVVSDVAADKSIEEVVGTNGITVTSSTGETDKTYTVGLDSTTADTIDSALQSIVTQIDGAKVKTLTKDNNNANFLTGKNIVLTNEGGGIKVATADNLKGLTSVILGDVAGDTVVSLTQNGINAGQKVIRNVATGVNGTDAVNVNQLESVVNTAATKAKTEVAGGTNVAGVVKTTGTDGHDIYTVNVEGTKVAGSTDVVVSSTTDATTNDTTYTVRLSDDFKTKAKDQSVEKVVAGTGIKVTSTAGDDKTYTVELDDLVKTQLAKEESVVAADTNVVISQTKTNRTGGKEFEIKLADTVTLGTGDNQVVIDGTKGKVTAGLVTVNGKEGTINGLTNKTFDKDNFVSGQAATEDQLSAVAKSLTTDIANKGLNFKGNEGSVHRALGTALTIEGEKGADATQHLNENSKTAVDNLYVKAEGDKLEIKLSEDVKNLNSVVLGTDASDKDTVALTKDGINAGSKKVTHVADGTIANDSTDAVNGSQLFDVADSVKNNFGGNANVADDGTLTFTDIGGTGEDTIHDAIASLKKVTDLGVSIVTQIDGKDVKTLSKADNKANFVAGKNIALTAEKGAIKVSTKDDLEVNSIANVKGTKLSLGEGAITLATKKSNANPTGAVQIKNVAAGIADTDAVNVAQLKGVTKAIDNVASEMEDIKGGVSSAMAAALLPQAYLPGQSVVSLAGATYKKNTAVAVGLSTISDNGKWIIKGSLNTNSTGEVGGGIGAGYAW